MRRPLVTVVLASTLAGCLPPGIDYQQPVYYVPVLPLAAYPPAPFPAYYPTYGYPARGVDPYVAPAEVQFETPSLAVRALAGKISASASNGDCENARAAGNELEKLDAESHHAILAVDERYAQCVRGF